MSPLIQEVEDEVARPRTLDLTEVESTLRRLLLDVAAYVDGSPAPSTGSQVSLPDKLAREKVILRFTGGWVRDKLLGVESHDIDVAINKMTGFQFGLRLKEYLEITGNPEKYDLEGVATTEKQSAKAGATDKSKTVGGLHKIEANPEKSKHLETVTTRILGLDIDLVNLRKETYTDDSRNPQMEFGTPEEDALRRDATVNAMFYNINTEQIEDFTGQGFDDMAKHIIRTPLEPYQTFKDDPLRVLRLIRFASRLGYTIEDDALTAMANEEIKDALRRKISRERVGVELEKALRGPDPHEAMRLILDLNLYFTIFSDPTVGEPEHYTPETDGCRQLIDNLEALLNRDETFEQILIRDKEERYLAWALVGIIPYRDAPQGNPPEPGRRAPPPVATSVAKEGIKATNKVCDVITSAIRHREEISDLVDAVDVQKRRLQKTEPGKDSTARDVLGMAIRKWGPTWRSQVMYTLLVDMVENPGSVDTTERKYASFLEHLRKLDILDAYTLKPLLDGKQLAKTLSTAPGPWMKDALDVVMAWQLRNPHVKDPAEAIEEVKKHGELTSDLVSHFLKLTIRPLFVKAKPDDVTEQGRKNTVPKLPPKTGTGRDEDTMKPWKDEKDGHALALLNWCTQSLDERSVERFWPLLVPPILSLLDDWEVQYKRVGVDILHSLLKATPSSLLERTGLGPVFDDALVPCLTYLPSLTPEPDSIALLSTTFPTLFTLTRLRYPDPRPSTSKLSPQETRGLRIKALDTILQKGILHAYAYSSQYPEMLRVLFENLAILLKDLGIDSVRHLKYNLPMLTETLAHPLINGPQQHNMLVSAVIALQAVILNGWPRMPEHRVEVLKGVTLCWLKLEESEEGHSTDVLESELKEVVTMLKAAIGDRVDWTAELREIVEVDARLEDLLL